MPTHVVTRGRPAGSLTFDNDRALAYWIVLVGVPVLLALAASLLIAPSVPMPDYLRDAQLYASTGHIADTTYPVAFAWFAGLSIRALGSRGPEVLQAIFYLLSVLSIWALARRCGARPRYALFAALAAAAYPQLPVSVTKLWDVEMSVLLMALVMLLTVRLLQDGPQPLLLLSIGLVLGISLAQRPNMLLLVPLPAGICLAARTPWSRKLLAFVATGAVAALTLIAVNTLAHGSFFLSQNGPYNLVQGHNEYSIQTMLQDLTCEPSVAMILKADGITSGSFNEADPALQRYFKHRAFAYMRSHPLEEVRITAVKMWTLFRPNTRLHRGLSGMTVMILCMSLIFPVWLLVLFRYKERCGLDTVDRIFLVAAALYVLPFLITSSDPRYQIPLEICMLSHIGAMLTQTTARTGNSAAQDAAV